MKHPKADHFAFQVSDLDCAIAFYSQVLGFELLFRKLDTDHHEAFAFFKLEGANLELLQVLDDHNRTVPMKKKTIVPPYCPHVAIQTNDLERLVTDLQAKRIPILKGPLEISQQVKWLYIADPDNNVIEFVQWF